jgi:hypothetical protein
MLFDGGFEAGEVGEWGNIGIQKYGEEPRGPKPGSYSLVMKAGDKTQVRSLELR